MKIKLFPLVLLLIFCFINISYSIDYNANNTGSWNNPNCWIPVGVPGANDNVTIANSYAITLSADASCNNLTLNSINGTLLAAGIYTLEIFGTINGPSTTFLNTIITTDAGKIKFSGNSRALFGSNWNATPKFNCEIALNNNQTGTTSTSVKFSNLIVTSGIFQVGSTVTTQDLRIDGSGSNGTGDLTVNNGASLIVSARCGMRSSTSGTYCGNVNIYGNLNIQGNTLNGSSIKVKNGGKLVINKLVETALISVPASNITYEDGSTLQYDNLITNRQITGAEISNAINTRSIYNMIINHVTGIDLVSSPTIRNTVTITRGNITSTNSSLISYGLNAILIYNGTTAQTITSAGLEYPSVNGPANLTIDNIAGVSLNTSKTVNGTLALANGAFSIGSNTLTLNGSIIKSNGSLVGGSSSNIIFGGSVANTTLPSVSLNNLTLNRANGITLGGNIIVNGVLTLTSGLLTLGSYDLTLGSSATIGGTPTASNMIVADNIGQLIKNFSATGSFSFPVGDNTGTAEYSPVTLNFTAGTFSAGANAGVNLSNSKNTNNNSITDYLNRYWTISQTGISGYSCDVTFQYVPADVAGTEANIYCGKLDPVTGWTMLNAANNVTHQLTGTVTAFSTFTGGEQIAMPVELSTFTSSVNGRDVNLSWTTASEFNNSGFEILRSVQNDSWVKVGYIFGNGTKITPTNYTFEDKKLNTGKYNYRLKQIDYNGNFAYYNLNGTIEVGVPNKFDISQNYPNPFNPTTKVDFELPFDSKVSMKLYDMSGREVMTLVNDQRTAGYYTEVFNMSTLSSGTYFYRISANGGGQNYVMSKKMLLIK